MKRVKSYGGGGGGAGSRLYALKYLNITSIALINFLQVNHTRSYILKQIHNFVIIDIF